MQEEIAIYHCAKCGAGHKFTVAREASPVKVSKVVCWCGNTLVIDDPMVKIPPNPDTFFRDGPQ